MKAVSAYRRIIKTRMHDAEKSGMERFLSACLHLSDGRIFWSALLGLMGIPLEALCCFAVYRLIGKMM